MSRRIMAISAGQGFVYTGALAGIPATCTVGQIAFVTDATAGQNIYECAASNTWTQQSGGASINTTTGVVPYKSGASTFADSPITRVSATVVDIGSAGVLTWNSDTGVSRDAAGVIDVGTGAQGSTAGTVQANAFTTKGTTAGVVDFAQGTTNAAATPCTTANSICEQAPTAVTSYVVTKPGTAPAGIVLNSNSASVVTQSFSGDASHSVHVTGQTATKTIYSLCPAAAGGCNVAGLYRVIWYFNQGGTACGTPGTGGVTFALSWTDNAGAHSAVALPMDDASSLTATGTKFTAQTANTSAWASGIFNIWSTGAQPIQVTNTYTACSVGTFTFELAATVEQLQ